MSKRFYAPFFRWRPHPWHGLEPGPDPPGVVQAYIEMTPFDLVKYEVDKVTGYLRLDRPQRGSSQPPTLYGFIPQTYCADRVAALSPESGRGDGDPIDICVVSERPIARSEVIVTARVIGGLQVVDGGEADDKIIGVLANDPFWSEAEDIENLPNAMIDRLQHYFTTYKMVPEAESRIFVAGVYGSARAREVVQAAMDDYEEVYGE